MCIGKSYSTPNANNFVKCQIVAGTRINLPTFFTLLPSMTGKHVSSDLYLRIILFYL